MEEASSAMASTSGISITLGIIQPLKGQHCLHSDELEKPVLTRTIPSILHMRPDRLRQSGLQLADYRVIISTVRKRCFVKEHTMSAQQPCTHFPENETLSDMRPHNRSPRRCHAQPGFHNSIVFHWVVVVYCRLANCSLAVHYKESWCWMG